ncbi:MAG: PEGA domain-containing protein, partial [Acidobacteriota bacterium]
ECETGMHAITASADLYRDAVEKTALADGEAKELVMKLEPAFGTLSVSTMVADSADVLIDGRKIGVTPLRSLHLAPGRYILKLSKPLYADIEEEVMVELGRETARTFALSQNSGALTISAPGSDIFLDGKKVGTERYHAQLKPKRYLVRAERGANYTPVEKEVYIRLGETERITLEPEPKLGSVSIMVSPEEASRAEIFVNNEPKGTAPLVLPLLAGDYSITARMDAYLDATQTVTVKERENAKVNFEMLSYDGSQQQARSRWTAVKWVSAISAAAAGGAAVYFRGQSEKNFTDYTNAMLPERAAAFRTNVEKYDRLTNIGIAVAATALTSAVVSWIIESAY